MTHNSAIRNTKTEVVMLAKTADCANAFSLESFISLLQVLHCSELLYRQQVSYPSVVLPLPCGVQGTPWLADLDRERTEIKLQLVLCL